MRIGLAIIGTALALSGCDAIPDQLLLQGVTLEGAANSLEYDNLETNTYRAFQYYNQEQPFEYGAMSVVTAEHGEMHTYTLVPCGSTICGGSAHGPRATVTQTPDYLVVAGLYNRTFWISPGGDGAVVRADGETGPLAWDSLTGPF